MSSSHFSFVDYIRSITAVSLFFVIFLIATPFILLLLLVTFGKATNFIIKSIVPLLIRPVFKALNIRFNIKMHTDSITHPAIFIINHSSTLDMLTVLALGLPRVRFVAKWEFQYNPLFLILGRLTGQIFIRRKKSEEAIATLQKTYKRVHRNRLSVMMAPEGSRKHPGIIGPFKKGPFRIAMDLDYPIVPIYFEGNRTLSKGGTLITKSGSLTAHIHKPIDTTTWDLENLNTHIGFVREKYLDWADVTADPLSENP